MHVVEVANLCNSVREREQISRILREASFLFQVAIVSWQNKKRERRLVRPEKERVGFGFQNNMTLC